MTQPDGLRPFLRRVAAGERLTAAQMRAAMDIIFDGGADDVQIAGFLMGLAARGETPEEVAAAAMAMRARATTIDAPAGCVDTCGTGGDGAGAYNVSTAAAIVAAGAGAKVAKHGNRAASSKSGSSDVLAALGVDLDAPPGRIVASIDRAGVGFLFAPRHHGAVGRAAAARTSLGARTLFNLLGPLTNPAGAKRQLLGVYAPGLLDLMAGALQRLGAERAMVVHGADGLDELSIAGPTFVAELNAGEIRRFEIAPEDAGLARSPTAELAGGSPQENADALRRILDGERCAYRDVAVLNAAATLLVCEIVPTLRDGAEAAAAAIDDGRARRALELLVATSNDHSIA